MKVTKNLVAQLYETNFLQIEIFKNTILGPIFYACANLILGALSCVMVHIFIVLTWGTFINHVDSWGGRGNYPNDYFITWALFCKSDHERERGIYPKDYSVT